MPAPWPVTSTGRHHHAAVQVQPAAELALAADAELAAAPRLDTAHRVGPAPEGWQLWVPVKRSPWLHPAAIVTYVLAGILLVSTAGIAGESGTPTTAVSPTVAGTNDPAPASTYSRTPTAEPTTEEPTEEATTQEPKPQPTVYKALTSRKWKKIAKDPDAYAGEIYVVYGQVTQFDAATGTDMFLADVGGVRDPCDYDICLYPTNTILTGDESRLEKLVEDDVFRAKITVLGSQSYETQIGGETTVPSLQVDRVKVLG